MRELAKQKALAMVPATALARVPLLWATALGGWRSDGFEWRSSLSNQHRSDTRDRTMLTYLLCMDMCSTVLLLRI